MVDVGVLKARSRVIDQIRKFFKDKGFWEVQTPVLAPALIPESYLDFFETKFTFPEGKRQVLYLTPSPEMWMKRLLVEGSGNIFELRSCFRNRDKGRLHNPEFLLLEWYRVGVDIFATMEDTEELVKEVLEKEEVKYQGKKVDLRSKFERLRIVEAFERYVGIKEADFFEVGKLVEVGKKRRVKVEPDWGWEEVFNVIYVSEVEPNLGFGKPVFIYDFPSNFAPLAKKSKKDVRFKERFELFINGVEICDGYSELDDPEEQRREFEKEIKIMKSKGKKIPKIDWEFIEVLKKGLPMCSGVALGVDRLVMIKMGVGEMRRIWE